MSGANRSDPEKTLQKSAHDPGLYVCHNVLVLLRLLLNMKN